MTENTEVIFGGKKYDTSKKLLGGRGNLKNDLLKKSDQFNKSDLTNDEKEKSFIETSNALTLLGNYYSLSPKVEEYLEFLNELESKYTERPDIRNLISTQIYAITNTNIRLSSDDLTSLIKSEEKIEEFSKERVLEYILNELYKNEMKKKLEDKGNNIVKTAFALHTTFHEVVLPEIIKDLLENGEISEKTRELIEYNFNELNNIIFDENGNKKVNEQDSVLLDELECISSEISDKVYSVIAKNLVEECKSENNYSSFKRNFNFINGAGKLGEEISKSMQRISDRHGGTIVPSSSNIANNNQHEPTRAKTVISKEELELERRAVIRKDNLNQAIPVAIFPTMVIESFEENREYLRAISCNEFIFKAVSENDESLMTNIKNELGKFVTKKGNHNVEPLRDLNIKLVKKYGININDISNIRLDFIDEYMKENDLEQNIGDEVKCIVRLSKAAEKVNSDKFEDIFMDKDVYSAKHPNSPFI